MGEMEEACERLLDSIEDAINSLVRGQEECESNDWELFAPEDLQEIIDRLKIMASKLNIRISQSEESDSEE